MTKIFAKLLGRKQESSADRDAAAAQAALMARVNRVTQPTNSARHAG